MAQWTQLNQGAYNRATNILIRRNKNKKMLTLKQYNVMMTEAYTEELKVNDEDLPIFDSDIEAMDIWTHEKVKLQNKRNANKKDFNLDELIGKVNPTTENDSIDDLF